MMMYSFEFGLIIGRYRLVNLVHDCFVPFTAGDVVCAIIFTIVVSLLTLSPLTVTHLIMKGKVD